MICHAQVNPSYELVSFMESVPEESFEYNNLDKQTRNIVWQYTSEIKDLMRLTAENIISIGQKLTLVKSQLGHGSFQKWLRTEFEWSEQTARQFMQVYRWSSTIENKNLVFSELGTSALYLLAAPSTPPEAREEILGLVDGGEKISYTRAKDIVNRYKELPLSVNDDAAKEIDIEIKPATSEQTTKTNNLLFRLETSELSCIVKLYYAHELEATSNLTVGATVKIKIGRWQGQTAKIVEVLDEQQLIMTEGETIDPTPAASFSSDKDTSVSVLDETDFSDLQKFREVGQHLIISYGNICLAIKGNDRALTIFTQQIKTDPEFIKEIIQQALNKQSS